MLRGLSPPDTRARDQEGLTLLHWATDRGHEDIVTMLVDTDPELINMQVTTMDTRQTTITISIISPSLHCMGMGIFSSVLTVSCLRNHRLLGL